MVPPDILSFDTPPDTGRSLDGFVDVLGGEVCAEEVVRDRVVGGGVELGRQEVSVPLVTVKVEDINGIPAIHASKAYNPPGTVTASHVKDV